jgi:hypothetical protein
LGSLVREDWRKQLMAVFNENRFSFLFEVQAKFI